MLLPLMLGGRVWVLALDVCGGAGCSLEVSNDSFGEIGSCAVLVCVGL